MHGKIYYSRQIITAKLLKCFAPILLLCDDNYALAYFVLTTLKHEMYFLFHTIYGLIRFLLPIKQKAGPTPY